MKKSLSILALLILALLARVQADASHYSQKELPYTETYSSKGKENYNQETYTETTYEWKHEKASVLGSAAALIISFILIWWNEARTVRSALLYKKVRNSCKMIQPQEVVEIKNGQLIQFTDLSAQVIDPPSDPYFKFQLDDTAIVLKRKVEMKQWKEKVREERRDVGGGKIEVKKHYSYEKVWSESPINSSSFKLSGYSNPSFPSQLRSESFSCSRIECGNKAIHITVEQCSKHFSASQQISQEELHRELGLPRGGQFSQDGIYLYRQSDLMRKEDVGSVRVSFLVARSKCVSVLGVKSGNMIQEFVGDYGYSLLILKLGMHSMEDMIKEKESQNSLFKWGLRILGLVLMYAGIYGMFEVFLYYLTWIPFFEPLLDSAASFVSGLIALPLSLITMVLAWIFYRPWALVLIISTIVALIGYSLIK